MFHSQDQNPLLHHHWYKSKSPSWNGTPFIPIINGNESPFPIDQSNKSPFFPMFFQWRAPHSNRKPFNKWLPEIVSQACAREAPWWLSFTYSRLEKRCGIVIVWIYIYISLIPIIINTVIYTYIYIHLYIIYMIYCIYLHIYYIYVLYYINIYSRLPEGPQLLRWGRVEWGCGGVGWGC